MVIIAGWYYACDSGAKRRHSGPDGEKRAENSLHTTVPPFRLPEINAKTMPGENLDGKSVGPSAYAAREEKTMDAPYCFNILKHKGNLLRLRFATLLKRLSGKTSHRFPGEKNHTTAMICGVH
jgi:hypothetical protein